MTSPARPDAGFTLLEVLAALVVLGFLMAGLSGGVRLGLRAWDQQERAVAGHGDLDAADRAVRRLIAGIYPGTPTRTSMVDGTAGRLAMVTALPASAPARMAEVALGLDGQRLVMRWTPLAPGRGWRCRASIGPRRGTCAAYAPALPRDG